MLFRSYVEAEVDPKYNVDTAAYGILTMKSGLKAMFHCSFNSPMRNQYVVKGTKGFITVPRAYRPDLHDHEGIIRVETEQGVREEKIIADQYKLEVEHFSQAIIDDVEPVYNGEGAILNMQAIEACYEALK